MIEVDYNKRIKKMSSNKKIKTIIKEDVDEKIIGILDDKYELLYKIGLGGTATVWKAKTINRSNNKDKVSKDEDVAIKILNNDNIEDKNKVYFQREYEILSLIKHNNVIGRIDGGFKSELITNEGKFRVNYLCLEFMEHGDLLSFIKGPKRKEIGFGEYFGRYIFKEILQGLSECHKKGIVHRDLKLNNIMINKDFSTKIADFGFSNFKTQKNLKGLHSSYLGTIEYVAPEILLNKPYYGEYVDIFSLGVLLFNLVTGTKLFNRNQIREEHQRIKDIDSFLSTIEKSIKSYSEYSDDFISLISLMISWDIFQRPSLKEILSHPWMNFEIPQKEEMIDEYKKRLIINQKETIIKFKKQTVNQENTRRKLMKLDVSKNSTKDSSKNTKGSSCDSNSHMRKVELVKYDDNEEEYEYISSLDLNNSFGNNINGSSRFISLSNYNLREVKTYIPKLNNCKFIVKNSDKETILENILTFFEYDEKVRHILIDLREYEFVIKYKHNKEIIDLMKINDIKIIELEIKVEIRVITNILNKTNNNNNNNKDYICEFFKCEGDITEFYEVFDKCMEFFDN